MNLQFSEEIQKILFNLVDVFFFKKIFLAEVGLQDFL